MKETASEKKIVFNLFDVLIICLILVAAAAVLIVRLRSSDTEITVVETKTVRYVVELTDLIPGTSDMIRPGDVLIDTIKKYEVGTVVSCTASPTVKNSKDLSTGDFIQVELPERETATITIDAECTESESTFLAGGGFIVRGGESVSLRGPGYYGSGFIIYIERGDGE